MHRYIPKVVPWIPGTAEVPNSGESRNPAFPRCLDSKELPRYIPRHQPSFQATPYGNYRGICLESVPRIPIHPIVSRRRKIRATGNYLGKHQETT